MRQTVTFYEWVIRYAGTPSIRGQFADYVITDKTFPQDAQFISTIEKHIQSSKKTLKNKDSLCVVARHLWDDYIKIFPYKNLG